MIFFCYAQKQTVTLILFRKDAAMKKYFVAFVAFSAIVLLWPALSSAIFIIELKNGRIITAENYITEGNKIILYLKSGEIRISKDEIKSISEKKVEVGAEKKEEAADQKKVVPELPDTKKSTKSLSAEKQEIDSYVRKKSELQERLEVAKKVYFDARDKFNKDRARETMTSISRELFSLQEEVMKKNGGSLPEWWEKTPN